MRALVTGATGFIGSNVVRELITEGAEVRALARKGSERKALVGLSVDVVEGDLLDRDSLERAVQGCEVVFHVGALYAFWPPAHSEAYRVNVEGTRNILAAARAQGVKRFIHTSSSATIGLPAAGTDGDEATAVSQAEMLKGYKESKYLAEVEALKASKEMAVVVVNPTAPVGAWDVKPTPTGRIVLDFMKGRMFGYVDTGLNVVHVRDVARGHILAFEKGRIGERYILGNRNMSLREIFAAIGAIVGRPAPKLKLPYAVALGFACLDELVTGRILHRTPRAAVDEVRLAHKRMYFSAAKAVRELGMPQTPVESAFADAVSWFKAYGYV